MKEKTNQTFWNFSATAENMKEVGLYIYGDIVGYDMGGYNWPDDVVPNKFKNELQNHADAEVFHVHINSNGGDLHAAYAIYSLLKNHKAKVITYNDGICASAATIIAMAGNKIVSAPYALWMYHLPMFYLGGYYNAPELEKLIKTLNITKDTMVDLMCQRTGLDAIEIEEILTNETYISGRNALERKLVDEIIELEVVAYLDEDKKTAFFNGIEHDLSNCKNFEPIKAVAKIRTQEVPKNTNLQVKINKSEEDTILNLAELQEKYPDIYNAAVQEGIKEGIKIENARIKGIEEISLPGTGELANSAKYEDPLTPEQFAFAVTKSLKAQGLASFNAMEQDAKALTGVASTHAPMPGIENNSGLNEQMIKDITAKAVKGLR